MFQHSLSYHQKLLYNRYYMIISKTLRELFVIETLFQKLHPFVCMNSFLMVLSDILYSYGMVSIRGTISMILCEFDGHGPYLQGVEVRFEIGALKLKNGVCIYSPLVGSIKKCLSLTQKWKYKKTHLNVC